MNRTLRGFVSHAAIMAAAKAAMMETVCAIEPDAAVNHI
jgi:hypothetical protein